MPEYPEVMLYLHALEPRIVGQRLERLRIASPSLLRSVEPPPSELEGRRLTGLERIGKRIVFAFEDDLFAVLHLMIAGRLQWKPAGAPIPRRLGHAAFDFESGTLLLTEAGTKKRAQLHLVRGRAALETFDRGGVDPLQASLPEFAAALRRENRTLKRALTDPRILSGIGNAHSDEILHEAQLSPARLTSRLEQAEIERLYEVTRSSLASWADLLVDEAGGDFPAKVTAFHPRMAVHGRYGKPCPRCGSPIQRIRYADNETNYCPTCQTGGKLLADRAFSRLLREDWPRSLDELEQHFQERR
ncbi:MAG TPA: DNA-formamidopyrimidine glycosylase family protein [Longimicrobiales bacterium]|nr:DNA-formamidopyrimidine glycosylase family protein [Longimicrobiales bacterium]